MKINAIMTSEDVKGRVAMSIYNNFVEASEEMTLEDAKDFLYSLIRYGLRGESPNTEKMSPSVRICWKMALPKLNKDIIQFNNGKQRKERQKAQFVIEIDDNDPSESQVEANSEPNESQHNYNQ